MSNVVPFNENGSSVLIPEERISLCELMRLLRSLVMDCEIMDDQILISDGLDTVCAIKLYEDAKLIQFETQMPWKQDTIPTLRKLNQVHIDLVMVRFYLLDRDIMSADYFMTYDGGLSVPQLVKQLRRFAKIAWGIQLDAFDER